MYGKLKRFIWLCLHNN